MLREQNPVPGDDEINFDAEEHLYHVRGKVVLMRYGKNFRGLKAMNAERNGAIAALIYSDPEQDGYEP